MNAEEKNNWNDQHKILSTIITRPEKHAEAIALFLSLHTRLCASGGEGIQHQTYENELLQDIREETLRAYPVSTPGSKNSIVWHLWHLARIEDITMNILASDREQVLVSGQFTGKLQTRFIHSGNGMSEQDIAELSSSIDIGALIEYRKAVTARTRSVISAVHPEQLNVRLSPERFRRITEEGAVKDTEQWLLDYWGNISIAGLILMAATRHNFMHLNQSMQIKQKLQ